MSKFRARAAQQMFLLAAVLAGTRIGSADTQEDCETARTVSREDVMTWTVLICGSEWEAHPATPSYDGTTGLFHMSSAYSLSKGRFSFSLFRDNLDRDPKDEDISIHGISLAFGVTNRIELYGTFGLQNRIDADALFQSGRANEYPFVATSWQTGVGDLKVGAKLKFLDDYHRDDPVAMAVRAFVKLPTANTDLGLGTGKLSAGLDVIMSKRVGEVLDVHGSVGFEFNADPDAPVHVDLANAFKWAWGLNLPARAWFQLQAELMGTRYIGGDDTLITRTTAQTGNNAFDPSRNPLSDPFGIGPQTNPVDLIVGPFISIHGFFIRPAISWNLAFDDRGLNSNSKSWTGRQISVGYHGAFGSRKTVEPPPPPPPPPPPANRLPTVSCEVERSPILSGETAHVRATASDPDGDPLTYDWSASAGRVTGSGATATFDSTGVTPSATVTIIVRVSDGRGDPASGNCPVQVIPSIQPVLLTPNLGEFSLTDHILLAIEPKKQACEPSPFLNAISTAASASGCSVSRLPDTGAVVYNKTYTLVVECSVDDNAAGKLRVETIFLARWLQEGGGWELSYHADAFEVSVRSPTDSAAKRYASSEARAAVIGRKGRFGRFFKSLDSLLKGCAPSE